MIFSKGRGVCNLCNGRKHVVRVLEKPNGKYLLPPTRFLSVERAFEEAAKWKGLKLSGIHPDALIIVAHTKTSQESGALL